jgi:hypothetical protein
MARHDLAQIIDPALGVVARVGDLPLDICAEDDSRTTIGLQRDPDESRSCGSQ